MKQTNIYNFVAKSKKLAKFTKPFIFKINARSNKSNPSNNARSNNLRNNKNN